MVKFRSDICDCTLEPYCGLVERNQQAQPRIAPEMYEEFPSHICLHRSARERQEASVRPANAVHMKPARRLTPVSFDGCPLEPDDGERLVESYATHMLDRPTGAREFHRILFTQRQWDWLVNNLAVDEKVILEGCMVEYDTEDEEVLVSTHERVDFEWGGITQGVYKRYIPGTVVSVMSVRIARKLRMPGESEDGPDEDIDMPLPYEHLCYYADQPEGCAWVEEGYGE